MSRLFLILGHMIVCFFSSSVLRVKPLISLLHFHIRPVVLFIASRLSLMFSFSIFVVFSQQYIEMFWPSFELFI